MNQFRKRLILMRRAMKYSVIIPVYNAEKTLHRCVDSLLNQNCSDAEMILINDGSTDSSGEICRQYCDRYEQIRYIEKKNGGVSSARNAGLAAAVGKYILFVDSDDYVTEDYFSGIDAAIASYDCDLIQFSQYYTDGKTVNEHILPQFCTADRSKLITWLSESMCRKHINKPSDKVYKRDVIERYQMQFLPGLSVGEDRTFNVEYALHSRSICVIDKPLYYISLENDQSLSRKKRNDLDEQTLLAAAHIREAARYAALSESERELIDQSVNFDILRTVYTKAKYLYRTKSSWTIRIREIGHYCRDINKQNFAYPNTRFCKLICLPVRWRLTWVIDAMAWVLTR